jgi:ABC-type dipeptide/oligopeptide/nickel transport system ATPase component
MVNELEMKNFQVAFITPKALYFALSNISFSLERGKTIGLWGQSGCGKSTIMKALLGLPLETPGLINGEVFYRGKRITPEMHKYIRYEYNNSGNKGSKSPKAEKKTSPNTLMSVRKNDVSFRKKQNKYLSSLLGHKWRAIFQEPIYSFEPDRYLGDQFDDIIGQLSKHEPGNKKLLNSELVELLEKLNINFNSIRSKSNLELSGGECQRIALALSLIGKPQLVLADEPTTMIDASTRNSIYNILLEKQKSMSFSMILASHNKNEIEKLADSIAVIYRGEVIERFTKDLHINKKPEYFHPYTRRLWFNQKLNNKATIIPSKQIKFSILQSGCPYAKECQFPLDNTKLSELCFKQKPPFFAHDDGHELACWLPQISEDILHIEDFDE